MIRNPEEDATMGDKSPKKENKAQPKKDLKEKRKEKQEKKAAGKTWST